MTQALYILLALTIGLGAAVQTGMIAALGRSKGPTEATWISLLATLSIVALALGVRALRADPPSLPSPFSGALIFVAISAVGASALAVSLKGVSPYLALTGFFGFAYLVSAAFLAPRIGIALFAGAVTAGTLLGSVALDHIGAFGADVQRVSLLRGLGLAALIVGVVLVRSSR